MAPMGRTLRLPPGKMGTLQGTSLEDHHGNVRYKWITVVAWDPHHEGSPFG